MCSTHARMTPVPPPHVAGKARQLWGSPAYVGHQHQAILASWAGTLFKCRQTCAGKGQRLWGSPAWRIHIWGMLTWSVLNATLWFCFVWWLLGKTHVVWIIGASAYGGVIVFHGIVSSRYGARSEPSASSWRESFCVGNGCVDIPGTISCDLLLLSEP